MKDLAFLVLAHTDPVQVGRLCHALNHRARIFVHVDAKVDIGPFLAQPLPASVSFIADRVTVSWAAYSQVEATLRLMKAALECGHAFSHLLMLSGLDYPIKPIQALHEHLNRDASREFIRFVDATHNAHHGVYFNHYWFLEANQQLPRRLDRALRHGFGRALRPFLRKPRPSCIDKVCWGSAYWALTPDCAAHVLNFTEHEPSFVRWAKSSFAVDEHFFPTIVAHSPYLKASEGFQPYEGTGPQTWRLGSLHINRRKVHVDADFEELRNTDKFFVRKLMTGLSDTLLNRLDAEILHLPRAAAVPPKWTGP